MQKIIAIIAIVSSLATVSQAAHVYMKDPPPIHISYGDLLPEVRKEVDCLADNIYFEGRGEPVKGQKAIAIVTMNRVADSQFPSTVCGVVKQRDRFICQFTWWCDNNNRTKAVTRNFSRQEQELYNKIRDVAINVYINHQRMTDITQGALFYHTTYVDRRLLGVRNIEQTAVIGQHIFYRMST